MNREELDIDVVFAASYNKTYQIQTLKKYHLYTEPIIYSLLYLCI